MGGRRHVREEDGRRDDGEERKSIQEREEAVEVEGYVIDSHGSRRSPVGGTTVLGWSARVHRGKLGLLAQKRSRASGRASAFRTGD